ncbi:SurA N-terminal domain-containing protein [Ferrimonas pelagia]|uniref:Periplasmic chaperone PpiD n=1 Tax=Ferrimonas pelagia TaxID=1177826 RepID=A0ABP9E9A3_9GAMM
MLEKIREGSQGPVAKIILGAVILSFALTGVYSYLGTNAEQMAADVNGEEISRYDLDQAFQNEQGRMRAQLGEMFDSLAADSNYMAGLRQSVLDRLIAERLIDQKVDAMGLRVSDAQIQAAIVSMAEFQVDGRFDNDRYQAVLRQNGLNGMRLRDLMRRDMARQQLMIGLMGSEFSTQSEVLSLAQLQQQTRDLRYVQISAADFQADLSVTEEEIEAYYSSNPLQFVQDEQVKVEFVELNVADMAASQVVSDEEANEYYQAQSTLFTQPERRLAAHMLFEGSDGEERAEAALARVRAGESFAEVAKDVSDDTFTADNGGELDWMTPGTMDQAFDAVLFGLAEGGVSEVVSSDYGYQLIHAKEVEASTVRPFADVQASITETLQADKAQREFYELQQTLADVSFEVPDSLEEAAEAIGAKVQTSVLFERNMAPAPLNNPRALAAAFSEAVLLDAMNSDLVEIESGHMLVLRVIEHIESGTKALADVRAQIEQRLLTEKASELAQQQADAKLAAWQAGTAPEGVIAVAAVSRFGQADLDPTLVQSAFKMVLPESGSAIDSVRLPSGDIAVVALDAINVPEQIDGEEQLKGRLAQQMSEAGYQALVESLRAEATILYQAGANQ